MKDKIQDPPNNVLEWKKTLQALVKQANKTTEVVLPPGIAGAKFLESSENNKLDLSGLPLYPPTRVFITINGAPRAVLVSLKFTA